MKFYQYYREQDELTITDIINNSSTTVRKPSDKQQNKLIKKLEQIFSLRCLFLCLLAFFLSRAAIWNELLPFGLAFHAAVCCLLPEYALLTAAAVVAGSSTCLEGAGLLPVILISGLILSFKTLLRSITRRRHLAAALFSFFCVSLVKTVIMAFDQANLYDYVAIMAEALFSAVLTLVFLYAIPVFLRYHAHKKHLLSEHKFSITGEELFCLLITTGALLAGIDDLNWQGITANGVLGKFLILTAAWIGGGGIGAAGGVAIALIPSLSQVVLPSLAGVYALAGLLAGALARFGRLAVVGGFWLGGLLMFFYLDQYQQLNNLLLELAAASLLFMLLPPRVSSGVRGLLGTLQMEACGDQRFDNSLREIVSNRLNDCSRIMGELSQSFQAAASTAPADDEQLRWQQMLNSISERVCYDCSLRRICWEQDWQQTGNGLLCSFSQVVEKGVIYAQDLPERLAKRCSRQRELVLVLNCLAETYSTARYWQGRLLETKNVLGFQLQGIAELIQNMAGDFGTNMASEENMTTVIGAELTRLGIQVSEVKVSCCYDADDYEVSIIKQSCKGKYECSRIIAPLISQTIGRRMAVLHAGCSCQAGQTNCLLRFCPSLKVRLRLATAAAAKDGSEQNGDSCSALELVKGKYAMILSDGMGTGKRAYHESCTAREMLEKLLTVGFDQQFALKMVNYLLILRSPEEIFTTLDLVVVDLYQCTADFLKVAAAPSYIVRDGKVIVIKSEALPLGVQNELDISVVRKRLRQDDILLIVSDGVACSGRNYVDQEMWIANALEGNVITDPRKIAEKVLLQAQENYGGRVKDDLTILAAVIEETD